LLYLVSDQCHFMMYMDSRLGISYDFIKKKTTDVAVMFIFGWFSRTVLLHIDSKVCPDITKQKYCYSSHPSSWFSVNVLNLLPIFGDTRYINMRFVFWDFLILCKCCILCKFCFRASVFYAELLLCTLYLLFTHIWEYLILCIQNIYNNTIWTNLSDFHIIIDNV